MTSSARFASFVAIMGSVAAIALHLTFGLRAGALWRDEVNSLNLATVGSLSEMWGYLNCDSIPALFLLLLRFFAGVPAEVSDLALRGFGVVMGLLVLGAIWLNGRLLGTGVPLIALALIGFNPMMIRYGDSIRAYGLGIFLILLFFGAIWKLVESTTWRRFSIAAFCAVLSVQCLYYNAVLVLAICVGGGAVTLRARRYRDALVMLTVGGIAALSLLFYWNTMQQGGSTNFMWKVTITNGELWKNFVQTVEAALPFGIWFWGALCLAAVGGGIWSPIRKAANRMSPARRDRLLFALVTLIVGAVCYAGFLRALSYRTRAWYYLALIAFMATCLEVIFASLSDKKQSLGIRAALALVLIGVSAYPAWQSVQYRQTNVDLVAAHLATHAQEHDLVMINPWIYGISFQRYYKGRARIVTIPPLEDVRFYRVDLAKERMMSPEPLAPALNDIADTLRNGHTVWLLGTVDLLQPNEAPLKLPPGYDGPDGWVGGNFYRAWSEQAAFVLVNHAEQFERIKVPLTQPVIHYENVPLSAFRGWH